jgi:hypothetical protein
MVEDIKLEFQITLTDWLEFRRREQSAFRLLLLRLADRSTLPLSCLLAASVLLVFLTRLGTINLSFPEWPPLALLVLLALCRIYLSVPSITNTRVAMKEWQKKLANLNCTFELTEEGFQIVSGPTTYQPTWPEVISVFQSENLLIFCDDAEYALLIPKRAFNSEEQLEEFVDLAYQKTVLDRNQLTTALS